LSQLSIPHSATEGLTLYNEFSTSYERDRMRGAAASATAAALDAATKAEL
jgi:hypothetical protein